jgi:nitrite reductase/ring-hydroxylating ferredoxin subunit/uncharacterized membrane protein
MATCVINKILNKTLDAAAARIERAKGLDSVADPVADAADKVLSPKWLTSLLSGTPISHPVHPLLVTIPIGAWTSSVFFDMTGQKDAADALVGLGVLAAVPTAMAGISDWRHTSGAERRIGLVHAISNNVATSAYAASWLARRSGRRTTGIVLSLVGATAVSVGGWLGGHLSYALGVGVDTTAFQHGENDWTYLADESDVQPGVLRAADLGGVSVLLTRTDDAIVALADRCTHRGGPLHEGELRDGCVVCPWHGSVFALDGSVVEGPATRPQPAYEVRITDGQVFARRAEEPRSLRNNPVGV